MIRKLKIRFVGVAMASLLVIMLAVIITINLLFWRHSIGSADDMLIFLAGNNGSFPAVENIPEDSYEFKPEPSKKHDRPEDDSAPARSLPPEFRLNRESPFRTRCFSVLYDAEGNVSQVRTERIAAISDDQAQEMAMQVRNSGRIHGFSDIYRFYAEYREDGLFIGFLDCNDALSSFQVLAAISTGILFFCLLAMFILVLLLSGRAIRPAVESMARQKQFIADAGHELKTPLTIINANTAVLSMTGCDNEWTQSIRNQTRRLDGLVQEMLTLSRVEADAALPMEEFDLSEAAMDVISAFESLIQSKNRHFSADIHPEVRFYGSEEHLRRLISILMDNAAKYTPEAGEVRFSMKKAGRNLLIKAENSCAPIEKRHLDHLFERFYRVDAARSQETRGYGIGLSIAREIVEKHRGKINAKCPEPNRIVFTITLPLSERKKSSANAE